MPERIAKLLLLAALAPTMGAQYLMPVNTVAAAGGLSCSCATSANGIDFSGITNATDDYAFMLIQDDPANNILPDDTEWVIGGWFRSPGQDIGNVITQWGTGAASQDEQFRFSFVTGNKPGFRWGTSATLSFINTAIVADTWYFVVVSRDSTGDDLTMWVYKTDCNQLGTPDTDATGAEEPGTPMDVVAGVTDPESNPPLGTFDGQMAYLFYAEGAGSEWTATEVANACVSGQKWCDEMADLETGGWLKWAYPLDGKSGDDCSSNEADATFTEVGDQTVDAYGSNGPYG